MEFIQTSEMFISYPDTYASTIGSRIDFGIAT